MRPLLYVAALAGLAALADPGWALSTRQINITGAHYTSLDGGVTQVPLTVTNQTLANGALSASMSGQQSELITFGPGLTQSFSGAAKASANAFADFGTLRLDAFAEASAGPLAYVAPFPGVLGDNPYEAVARSTFYVAFRDEFDLVDPAGVAPIGTPVSYRLTVVLDSTKGGGFSGNLQIAGGLLSAPNVGGTFNLAQMGNRFVFSVDVNGHVGERHILTVSLVAGAFAAAGKSRSVTQSTAFFDASNTLHAFLDPLSTDLALASESGHDYATSAVPEASVLALLGLAAALLIARR